MPDIIRLKKENSSYTETDEEYIKSLSGHFHDVFNSDVKTIELY